MRFRTQEIIIGALVATAFWIVIFVLTSDTASHYEICEVTKEGAKECAAYNIIGFALRKVGMSLDVLSALITAIATIFIARFTFTLKRSTDNLWEAGTKQLKLARDEFISSHRPELRLKHIWICSQDGQSFIGNLERDVPLTVRLDIVNVGAAVARIHSIHYATMILDPEAKLPQLPPYDEPGAI